MNLLCNLADELRCEANFYGKMLVCVADNFD